MTSYKSACGIYRDHSIQWVDKKLDAMPYAQAGIIKNSHGTFLKSYETIVINIDNDGWMHVSGLYSRTTIKHISAFMREISGGKLNYYHAKKCYQNNELLNIYTGEIKKLSAA